SNAPEEPTIDIARRVEVFRDYLARLNPQFVVDASRPMALYVFRDDYTFIPYKLLGRGQREGMAANIDGYFTSHADGIYLSINATPATDPWPVIYHEYAHFFLSNNFTDIPLWVNEGMAEYFGTFRVEGTSSIVGGPIKSHIAWLRDHETMPLKRLFNVDYESPEYHEDSRQGTYYAQSWAVTHYFLWNPDGPGGMEAFMRLKPRGTSLAASLAPLTAHPGETEEKFLAWLKAKRFPYHETPLEKSGRQAPPKVAALSRAEAYYRLGDLLRHVDKGRLEAAAEHFRAALNLEPERADAQAGLGQTLFDLGRREEARAAFEKAYARAPDDPTIALRYGLALVEAAFPPHHRKVVPRDALPADLLRGRSILETLTRRPPVDPQAWSGLGTSYAFDGGDIAPGIAALETAHALLPTRPDIAVNLAWLYLRSGQREKVRPLYEATIRDAGDRGARAEALEAVFWADFEMAQAAPAEERQARLDKALAGAPTAALRAEARNRLQNQVALEGQNTEINRFNEAVTKSNAGDLSGAAAILDRLLETATDPEVRAQAMALRANVRDNLDRAEAVRRANAGDHAGATAILNRLLKSEKDPAVQKQLRDLLTQVEVGRQGALYNQAVDKTNKKDYSGALAIIDRLQPEVRDPKLLGLIKDLRRNVEQATSGKTQPSR
ncbi:MAG TPA: tetratricopeptide repeat protein, partial [Candidatus Polarisedimenticolia bacterium]|nr:tetratricopeptide repeat protein [Candidatus Polarisedimenticolia bacterium]